MNETNTSKKRILVVDDDPSNFKVVLEHFRHGLYELMYAPNGAKGCEVAEREVPDLVLMDWEMPVMNGIEAIKKLKALENTAKIPVLMMTGIMTSSENLKMALEAGATDFLNKPFDELELNARVGAALSLAKSILLLEQKNREIKELLEREIAHKDRELMLETMHRQESSDFINTIGEKLKAIGSSCTDERTEKELIRLVNSIRHHERSENSWESFTAHFQQVHPGFFKSLTEKFPAVTPNEERLAAYIRIGLNNKEISQLLGVTIGTTKTNLNRLKKKLSLTGEESIRQFFRSF